ncbi:HEAT repeat domain-containing protein [Verrucomicrobiaceae bacterium R5-34]|nr:HEAT repeat domain-containing protein [Verrucomicrobiaceae bacterium R5-34]
MSSPAQLIAACLLRAFVFGTCLVLPVCLLAQPAAEISELTDPVRLQRLSGEETDAADWRWAARKIADRNLRQEIRDAVMERENYPRKELTALLSDEHLAVRLGSLELLEEAAGDSYGFNPWASPSGNGADPRNEHALKMWRQWAGAKGAISAAGPVLSGEQMQGYIRDIISGNTDRKRRAVRMLEPHGMKGVSAIQDFLSINPALPENSRLSLKEGQYQLVLSRSAGENASVLARDLTFGNRDQRLGAISALKKSGFLAIPIVRDYLGSDDALVRETAVDTILTLGGAQTVPLVAPYLKKEKDVNVIHAAMRRFREIGGNEVKNIIAGYLDHQDEDLVVSSVQSLTKLSSSSNSYSFSSGGNLEARGDRKKPWSAKIIKLLDDPRWRIRSAALDYIAGTTTTGAEDKVIDLLADKDEFVRAQAIKAAVALRLTKAQDRLRKMFLADDEMIAPATKALTGMNIPLSADLIRHLDQRPSDIIIAAIRAMDRDKKEWLDIVARYATSKDLDVACAALRSLANEEDKLEFAFVSNHLTSALKSGVDEKITAVIDSLDLPTSSASASPALLKLLGDASPGETTALDPLYDAFLRPLRDQQKVDAEAAKALSPTKAADATGGLATLTATLAELATDWSNHERAFRAALLLAKSGDERGMKPLAEKVASLSTSERAAIADGLYYPRTTSAVPLLRALMQDVVPDIRNAAGERAFDSDGGAALVQMALKQLELPNTKIKASEVYGYNLERAAGQSSTKRMIRSWCLRTLKDQGSDDQNKVLAIMMMRHAMNFSDTEVIEPFTKSSNQWLRRAAWYTLGKARASWLKENSDLLAIDPSPRVREVLPWVLTAAPGRWKHFFSDSHVVTDQSYSSSSRRASLSPDQIKILRSLAEKDPSAEVRFEAWFCLLSNSQAIDLDTFTRLLPQQPKEANVADRLANHIEQNYRRMGKGMKPLLAYANVKEISKTKLPLIIKYFAEEGKESSFTSFAALAQATESSGQPQHVESAEDPAEMAAKRQRLLVVVFHKPGCKECERVEKQLADMKSNFPLLEIERRNILNQSDVLLNRALCDRFGVSGAGKTPSLFTQAGAAIAPNTQPEMIGELLQSTMVLKDDPSWNQFGSEEIAEAKEMVEESFASLTLPLVLGAGLLDGVNPCAFATIIFFLSYLQVARRSPREILMVGGAFILAVFLAYFSVGLVFHSLVEKLTTMDGFKVVRNAVTYIFAGFALLVAILSLRDALRARKGNLDDMTLQLPSFLKTRIRGVIRKGAKARNFVIAAFISGILISFLELACTGQVYAPIIFQIQQGSTDAVFYLLLYNLAFILPLVIIFILAYRGMTSATLIDFQKKHTATVKFATAVLFVLLAVVILFSESILPH